VVARAVPAPAPVQQQLPAVEPHAPQEAFQVAYVDPVTGLANRDQLTLAVAGMRAAPRYGGALLVVGIGAARETPDDAVLRAAADRLRRCCRPTDGGAGDLPVRLSDIELAVLTAADLPQAYGLAYRIVAAFAESQACVGICDLAGGSSPADVLRRASLALSRASEAGPGRVEWYDPEVEKAVRRRAAVEAELPEALRRGQLDLIYQPIVDLAEDRPQAVEALLRWRHPQLGTLLPADVIPVAEQIGLIGDVGRWVLGQASAQLATWRGEGRDVSMAINVSPRGLDAAELVTDVTAALAQHGLPPSSLSFEFAEPAIDESDYLLDPLAALRAIGVRTALDAFGTGTASLAHLRRLPIDTVKLGRSFFDAAGDPVGSSVLDVMVGMGRRLGVDVVAHGVELPTDLQAVRDAHCRFGQGHIFAPPQPAEHIEAYLDRFSVPS
jgi:predicted signal transduction protein with EAL and GGDEF domain